MTEREINQAPTSASSPAEQRILLLALTERDARLSQAFLAQAGLDCVIFEDLATLCAGLDQGAGVLVIAEEMLSSDGMPMLQDALAGQPAWSDVPLIVLTSAGGSATSTYAMEYLGNVMLLERPVLIATLVSTVRTALRARRRQYQIRQYLREREQLYAAEQHA